MTRRDRLDTLTAANLNELLRAFALPSHPLLRAALHAPARRFARQLQHLDDLVAADGLAAGARWALRTFTRRLTTVGREQVPASGPLLAVANHPGLTDAMALVLALEARPDLRIVALDRPVLHALPAVRAYLLEVPDGDRLGLIAQARKHLKAGGAVLTFPAGTIEPDPSLRPAEPALLDWSRSVRALTRGIAGLQVVPLAVSGVISPAALSAAPARRLPDPQAREFAAATLQVLLPGYRDTDTRVVVGEPFTAGPDVHAVVQARMQALLHRGAVHTPTVAPETGPAEGEPFPAGPAVVPGEAVTTGAVPRVGGRS